MIRILIGMDVIGFWKKILKIKIKRERISIKLLCKYVMSIGDWYYIIWNSYYNYIFKWYLINRINLDGVFGILVFIFVWVLI